MPVSQGRRRGSGPGGPSPRRWGPAPTPPPKRGTPLFGNTVSIWGKMKGRGQRIPMPSCISPLRTGASE